MKDSRFRSTHRSCALLVSCAVVWGGAGCTDDGRAPPPLPAPCAVFTAYQDGKAVLAKRLGRALFDLPRGRLLLISKATEQEAGVLYSLDLASGGVSRLHEPATNVQWLGTDGSLLVANRPTSYIVPRDELTVIRPDGQVLPLALPATGFIPSADGRRVFLPGTCAEGGLCTGLFVIHVDQGGKVQELYAGQVGRLAVSADGERVAFIAVQADQSEAVRVIDLRTMASSTLAAQAAGRLQFLPSGELLFGVETGVLADRIESVYQLMIAAPAASPRALGKPHAYDLRSPRPYVVSNDGVRVLAAHLGVYDQPSELWAVALDGSGERLLARDFFPRPGQFYSQSAAFDAAGTQAIYVRQNHELVAVPLGGGSALLLAAGVSHLFFRFIPGRADELVVGQEAGKGSSGLSIASTTRGRLLQILQSSKPLQYLNMLSDGRGVLVAESRVIGPDPWDVRYVPITGTASTVVGERVDEGIYTVDPNGCALVYGVSTAR